MSDKAKNAKFERKPIQELKTFLSADGKYMVLKFITTWITPVKYISTILESKGSALPLLEFAAAQGATRSNGETNDRSD